MCGLKAGVNTSLFDFTEEPRPISQFEMDSAEEIIVTKEEVVR
jgi:hypothetical protein